MDSISTPTSLYSVSSLLYPTSSFLLNHSYLEDFHHLLCFPFPLSSYYRPSYIRYFVTFSHCFKLSNTSFFYVSCFLYFTSPFQLDDSCLCNFHLLLGSPFVPKLLLHPPCQCSYPNTALLPAFLSNHITGLVFSPSHSHITNGS